MDLKGSLSDTKLKIYPTNTLLNYLKSIPIDNETPVNIRSLVEGDFKDYDRKCNGDNKIKIYLNNKDIERLNEIKTVFNELQDKGLPEKEFVHMKDGKAVKNDKNEFDKNNSQKHNTGKYLFVLDLEWLYLELQRRRLKGDENVPYLHELLEGAQIETPENAVIKRNPDLEARCVKLRAQQEAREYRKMTKSVDNVRMRFPEDSISYQLKHLNRQLIAIGQFIISIFAGFLFGFRGIEWMVGNLDFGFRLLLGVMCALVIALAEIYFLAKKLNEELNIPETMQLGGPVKFITDEDHLNSSRISTVDKEHQD